MCSVDYCFKSVIREDSMYIRSSENLDDCFCGWQLSGYIAIVNVTNHSCHHNTSLTWFTFISLVFQKEIAEFQRRELLCHLLHFNVSTFPPVTYIRYWFRWICGSMEGCLGRLNNSWKAWCETRCGRVCHFQKVQTIAVVKSISRTKWTKKP
jgi:hypothetical protein